MQILRIVVCSCTQHQLSWENLGVRNFNTSMFKMFFWTLLHRNKNRRQNYLVMRPWKVGNFDWFFCPDMDLVTWRSYDLNMAAQNTSWKQSGHSWAAFDRARNGDALQCHTEHQLRIYNFGIPVIVRQNNRAEMTWIIRRTHILSSTDPHNRTLDLDWRDRRCRCNNACSFAIILWFQLDYLKNIIRAIHIPVDYVGSVFFRFVKFDSMIHVTACLTKNISPRALSSYILQLAAPRKPSAPSRGWFPDL